MAAFPFRKSYKTANRQKVGSHWVLNGVVCHGLVTFWSKALHNPSFSVQMPLDPSLSLRPALKLKRKFKLLDVDGYVLDSVQSKRVFAVRPLEMS